MYESTVLLRRGGCQGQRGRVLGSPLNALRHLNELLSNPAYGPPLSAGEVLTVGTLALAMPVRANQILTSTPNRTVRFRLVPVVQKCTSNHFTVARRAQITARSAAPSDSRPDQRRQLFKHGFVLAQYRPALS